MAAVARREGARVRAPGHQPRARGVEGTTALHTCFGYAHIVHDRPPGYPFLAELAECSADVLAIEAAQPRLDVSVLEPIAGKTVIVGVLDLSDPAAETPEEVAERIEAALTVIPPERLQVGPDCGMKYLTRELAFAKLRALVEGARLVRERLATRDRPPLRRTAKRSSSSSRNGWKTSTPSRGAAIADVGATRQRLARP